MPIQLTSRDSSGQVVTTDYIPGDVPPGADAAADVPVPSQTDTPAAPPASGQAPEVPGTSAPQPPAGDASGEGASPAESDDDLSPMPDEQASVPFVNKRIKQLNAKRRALEREHAAYRQQTEQRQAQLEGQIQMLSRILQGQAPTGDDVPEAPQGPPQSEQYDTHDDYVRAVTRYELQQQQQADQQRQAEQQRQQQLQDMQRQLQEREQAFRMAHPDFDEVIRTALVGRVAPHVQQALMVLEEGPALAYALARQPDMLQRLNTLPPWQVVAELGRLSPPTSAPPSTPTNGSAPPPVYTPSPAAAPTPLPPPPTPLSGAGQGVPPDNPADWSQAEFTRRWNAGWRPDPRDFGRG